MSGSTSLKELDVCRWERVLVVVAHPDDAEYGLSAAVNSWTKRGIEVAYLLLTGGEAGMQCSPEEAGPIRGVEQRNACRAVNVDDLTILSHPDGHLVYGLDLRRDIARRVREFRPTVVIGSSHELEALWGLDQADHRAAGLATLDGARDASNRWVFRDQIEQGLEPWSVSLLLTAQPPQPTHFVSVDADDEAAAVASLACHREYLADLPAHPKPADFIPPMLRDMGAAANVDRSVLFRAYDLAGILEAEACQTEAK
ncbi:PIG-L deacetylase family protein [Gulosibacter molinativorax]|uniref:GlcNAc-PI de-N-acetylase n=1 Tax=Gulosibacter molinativorax TaxID=256821 RepID=A0ABT7C5R2_9MICO|nr:PIG-L deacetylase family protein [Gulosibacter molinativorax]MDJ1370535.1 GlcNAc-PI de-N-acetylase [Gulosibacter molinativorax]QUY62052.1 Mycothiol S-conjugate amidase [Gulosibacter molinativorax]